VVRNYLGQTNDYITIRERRQRGEGNERGEGRRYKGRVEIERRETISNKREREHFFYCSGKRLFFYNPLIAEKGLTKIVTETAR
jgi:hypothetical protein